MPDSATGAGRDIILDVDDDADVIDGTTNAFINGAAASTGRRRRAVNVYIDVGLRFYKEISMSELY